MEQSLSLLELFDMLNDILGIKMEYTELPPRQSDQKVFVADITKINSRIGWKPQVTAREGVTAMVDWVRKMDI
jgi:CDP-paratose 2-epimerase